MRNLKTGTVRIVQGPQCYLLRADEAFWEKDLPATVERLLGFEVGQGAHGHVDSVLPCLPCKFSWMFRSLGFPSRVFYFYFCLLVSLLFFLFHLFLSFYLGRNACWSWVPSTTSPVHSPLSTPGISATTTTTKHDLTFSPCKFELFSKSNGRVGTCHSNCELSSHLNSCCCPSATRLLTKVLLSFLFSFLPSSFLCSFAY